MTAEKRRTRDTEPVETGPARRLFFNDGCVKSRNTVLIASQFQKFSGSDVSRVAMVTKALDPAQRQWAYLDFDDAALSVTYLEIEKSAFWMGHNGKILVVATNGVRPIENLPNVGKHGTVLRIRAIGDHVYVCGMSGQVYMREQGAWRSIAPPQLGTFGLDFEDIDGTGPDDLYAVGMGGVIFHYNGARWRPLDSPTNRPWSGVRCVSRDEVYICGDEGNLYRGNRNGWEPMGSPQFAFNYWGVEIFREKVYASHAGGIVLFDGTELHEVEFGLSGRIDCHRLDANDGVLWSFGLDTILYSDGNAWTEILCPANE